MSVRDNREWTSLMLKSGEAIQVNEEVDWDCEAGAIVRRVCEIGAPAPFFQKIKDYPGHRMLGAPMAGFNRIALSMGMKKNSAVRDIVDEFFNRAQKPIKPVMVDKAPCQENVAIGKDVDLTLFPAPMVHDGDGGRYLCSWHIIINKEPDTGWVNWGMYRMMVHNERMMGGQIAPTSDAGRIKQKFDEKGEPMPFAAAIGPDPLSCFSGAVEVGVGISEAEVAGGLIQEPVQLVKCKTVDLEVPANAEIILEGHVLHGVAVDEGPFGEYTGYRTSPRMPRSVYRIECITWRNNPITTMTCMGMPLDEGALAGTFGMTLPIRRILSANRIPYTGVYVPPEAAACIAIVATRKPYNNIAMHMANLVFGIPTWQRTGTILIVVDETVDPFNMQEVTHAIATKLHPLRGVHTFHSFASPLHPKYSLKEREQGYGGKLVLDCTWPLEWDPETEKPSKASFQMAYSPELQKKVLANWTKYGYKK